MPHQTIANFEVSLNKAHYMETKNYIGNFMGNGCGSVGRAVASDQRSAV